MGKEIIKSGGEIVPPVSSDLTKAFEDMGQLISGYISEYYQQNIFQRESNVIPSMPEQPLNESTESQKS